MTFGSFVSRFVPRIFRTSTNKVNPNRKGLRAYEAARLSRLTSDWITTEQAIDRDIRSGLVPVRVRARDLNQNNDLVKRFLNLCRVNIVGPRGFRLQSNVMEVGPDGTWVPDDVANSKIEDAWSAWTRRENCSIDGRFSFRQICNLLVTYKKRDGESFVRLIRGRNFPYGLRLQVIPPEAIDEKLDQDLGNGRVVKMGVELDSARRPVAYHVKRRTSFVEMEGYPVTSGQYDRVPASEMIHFFRSEFADQTRGVSELAQSMIRLRHLSGYEEAAVVNARVSASKMGFFRSPAGTDSQLKYDDVDSSGNVYIDADPGVLKDIGDKEFAPWDPTYPTAQHEAFVRAMGKSISAGLNVAYASLTNDLAEANYSSNRVGLLDEREMWKEEQAEMIEGVLEPIFSAWLEMALATGTLALPLAKYDKFNAPLFIGRRWAWIDPQKDIDATLSELSAGMTSLWTVAAERGDDLEQIFQDIKSVKDLASKYGVELVFGKSTPAPKPESEESDEGDDVVEAAKKIVKTNGQKQSLEIEEE